MSNRIDDEPLILCDKVKLFLQQLKESNEELLKNPQRLDVEVIREGGELVREIEKTDLEKASPKKPGSLEFNNSSGNSSDLESLEVRDSSDLESLNFHVSSDSESLDSTDLESLEVRHSTKLSESLEAHSSDCSTDSDGDNDDDSTYKKGGNPSVVMEVILGIMDVGRNSPLLKYSTDKLRTLGIEAVKLAEEEGNNDQDS